MQSLQRIAAAVIGFGCIDKFMPTSMRLPKKRIAGESLGPASGLNQRANMQSVQRIAAAVSGFGYVDQFDAVKYALAEKADRGRIAVVGVAA